MIHVGITGSKDWVEVKKIKEFIFYLKNKYKEDLTIITCGERDGVDFIVKKICNNLDVNYKETRPGDYSWNSYCMEGPYYYNKKKYPNNVFIRNTKFISYCDIIVVFINESSNNYVLTHLIENANKKNKKIIINYAK